MKPYPEMRLIQSRKANITPSNDTTSLQALQTSPKLGLQKSNAAEAPNAARSTTLSTKSPTKAILAHAEMPPFVVDYKSVLTIFFHANSPERVAEVDQFLQKYHVREEFFGS